MKYEILKKFQPAVEAVRNVEKSDPLRRNNLDKLVRKYLYSYLDHERSEKNCLTK